MPFLSLWYDYLGLNSTITVPNKSLYHNVQTGLHEYCNILSGSRTLLYHRRGKRWRTLGTLSKFTYTKIYSFLHFLSSCREKEIVYGNWVTHVSWTKRNNISWGERDSRHRPWIFFLYFLVVLTCLFVDFVFRGSSLVWDPFSEITSKWGPQPSAVFTFPYLGFNSLFLPHRVRWPSNFQTLVVVFLSLGVRGRIYLFPVVPHQHRNFGTSGFFLSFLIIVVINLWLGDQQRFFWQNSS